MTERTQEWAERVGREAVELGFVLKPGMAWLSASRGGGRKVSHALPGDMDWQMPDFRDRLTELACIAWVEDVAREVYGDVDVEFRRNCTGWWWVDVEHAINPDRRVFFNAPTLAEACIAAVRAMKGGE